MRRWPTTKVVGEMRHLVYYNPMRLSIVVGLYFSSLFLTSNSALAANMSGNYFNQFASPFLEMVKPESEVGQEEQPVFPIWTRGMTWEWLKYQPSSADDAKSPECNSQKWLETARQGDPSHITKAIEKYLQTCDQQIQSDWHFSPITTYLTLMLKWDEKNYPYGRLVLLHLPNGNRLKGFLAMKGDGKPRPLVIIRLGIFANVTQFGPERFMFMQLFEQSPFNVMVLESNSSKEYIFRNKSLTIGGFDEGIQDFLVAKNLQKSSEPISSLISGVHVAAMSMGGHGALFSSLINEWDYQKQNPNTAKAAIRSVLAYCPLVNYRDTMDFHLAEGVVPIGMNYWVSSRLHGVEGIFPGIEEKNFVESMVGWMDKNYQGPVALDESVPLNKELKDNLKKYWTVNQFWPFYKDVETPVLIMATKVDPIVPFQVNSQRLQNKYMDIGRSNLQVVALDAGLHCNLPGSYKWRPISSLSQAFILGQSDFKPEKMTRSLDLSAEELGAIHKQGLPNKFELHEGKNPSEFYLTLKLSETPLMVKSATFSFSEVGYAQADFSAAKDLLQRWFDQNLILDTIENPNATPKLALTWYR